MTYTDPKFRVFMTYLTVKETVQLENRIRVCDENRAFVNKDRNTWLKFLALEKFADDDTLAASCTSDVSIHTAFKNLVDQLAHRKRPKIVWTRQRAHFLGPLAEADPERRRHPTGVLERLLKEAGEGKLIVRWWEEEDGGEGDAENTGKYVYFIQAGAASLVKIGCSQNPFTQRTIFQRDVDEPLRIRKVYLDAGWGVKRMFQKMFAEARIWGGWFAPTDELQRLMQTAYY